MTKHLGPTYSVYYIVKRLVYVKKEKKLFYVETRDFEHKNSNTNFFSIEDITSKTNKVDFKMDSLDDLNKLLKLLHDNKISLSIYPEFIWISKEKQLYAWYIPLYNLFFGLQYGTSQYIYVNPENLHRIIEP